jgi:hypothetical protein
MKITITLKIPLKVTDNKIVEAYLRHSLKMFDIKEIIIEKEKEE